MIDSPLRFAVTSGVQPPPGWRRALRWLLPRLAIRVVLLLGVLFLAFWAVDRLPGSAATALLGRQSSSEALARTEHLLGLDRPLFLRYLEWLGNALRGDFGTTIHGRSIAELIASRLPITLLTSGLAFILIVALSLLGGAWLHRHRNSTCGRIGSGLSMALLAIPEFVIGTLLIAIFALALNVLPAVTLVGTEGKPTHLDMYVLPVLTLAIPQIAWNARVVAAALWDASQLPHVQSARLAGLRESIVLRRHIVPLAIPVIAASIATTAGMLFAGTVVVEVLFNHPGVGSLAAGALSNRDIPILVTITALTGAIVLILLTAADAVRARYMAGARL